MILFQLQDGILDLLCLDRTIDQKTNVASTKPNDLNGIFQAQSIVHQDQFVYEPEDIERQKGWDGLGCSLPVGVTMDVDLKISEHVARTVCTKSSATGGGYVSLGQRDIPFKSKSDYCLHESR